MSRTVEKHYLKQSTEIVDSLFDKGYFNPEIKRSDMRAIDELIGYYIQTAAESAVKFQELTKDFVKDLNNETTK